MPLTTDDPDVKMEEKEGTDLDSPWNVVLYDDPVNFMGFVTIVLRRVFGYSEAKAEELMLQVHHEGKSVVWTGVREQAELYAQQLQAHRLLASMQRAN
ncbi:MAG: ATP-dependent Clp protease adapter ClpS [Verrucomicrobia bacterium]|nr:ATP-dependent Clp protease adapter ClpS [Verrucomicrobiota bacterium]